MTIAGFQLPGRSLPALAGIVWRYRKILRATTEVELRKKYAGSALGSGWLILHPILFLLVYLFLFLVVFQVRFPGLTSLGYVVYVFSGLVPFLAVSEAMGLGVVAIRQNMHLIKNVIVPIDLIPVRTALIVLAAEFVGLACVILLSALDGSLSFKLLLLPVAMALQLVFLVGLMLLVASLGVLVPDLSYAINLIMTFLSFVSPIGFRPDALPHWAQPMIWLNPLYYMLETFRLTLIGPYDGHWSAAVIFAILAGLMLLGGAYCIFLAGQP